MGQIDISTLMDINQKIVNHCKENKLPFTFKVDHGTYETAIEFWEMGYHHPPKAKNWDDNPNIYCPDLLDYEHKLIIEYEEEGQKIRQGAKLPTKGHGREGDISNSKDTERNYYYRIGGFKLFQLWESDYKEGNWDKLYEFLSKNPSVDLITKTSIVNNIDTYTMCTGTKRH